MSGRAGTSPATRSPLTPAAGPLTATEGALVGIWRELLGAGRVGAHDTFFGLGGDSMRATRMGFAVRRALRVTLPTAVLFEPWTLRRLAEWIDARRREGEGAGGPPPLVRAPRGGPLPLTPLQEFYWLQHQMAPADASSNMAFALRLGGALRVPALEHALTGVVRRHEALRTTFAAPGGVPVQVVGEPGPVCVARVDLRALAPAAREREALRLAGREAVRPFDLERGPLLRALLLRLGERDWVLLAAVHHIVSDGWSMDVLVRELGALYGALTGGPASALPEPEVQFADYAVWQRGWLKGEVLERHAAYWRERLAGAPPLDLAGEGPGPARVSARRVFAFTLPGAPLDALRRLGAEEGATLFVVLLAAFEALLVRYTGQEDVTVETPLAGRSHPELAGVIGFFAQMALLRTDLSGDPPFREAVRRVRETTLGACAHQELPLFERLGPGVARETAAYQRLRRMGFALRQTGTERLVLGDVSVKEWGGRTPARGSMEQLSLVETGGGLDGEFRYRAEVFPEAVIEQAMRHYAAVLDQVAADPELRISGLVLAPAGEDAPAAAPAAPARRPSTADAADPGIVWALWRRHAAERPHADAVVHWVAGGEPVRWRWGALWERALRYAAALRRAGVRPGEVCATLVRHHPEFYPLYMGIELAGAIPTVLAYPNARLHPRKFHEGLEGMSRHSGIDRVLTERALDEMVRPWVEKEGSTVRGLLFPLEWELPAAEEPTAEADPGAPCLLQHSSGTTGLQKGVVLSHRAVREHVCRYGGAIAASPADRVVSWLPLYHDMGLIAAFHLPLALGIPTVQVDPFAWVLSPALLLEAISRERGTLCWLPNFAYNVLADRVHDDELEGLRLDSVRMLVNCSEPVRAESHARFARRYAPHGLPPQALSACYAMAETTFAATQVPPGTAAPVVEASRAGLARGRYEPAWEGEASRACVSSGPPISGVGLRVVEPETGRELNEGEVGELSIRSVSLFDGYRNNPEQTALALVDGWFRTGDLGFVLGGHAYVIGRHKDLIIVAGKNLYPEDVEDAVGAVPGILPGRVVAFGADDPEAGTERVCVVAETAVAGAADRKALRAAVVEAAARADVTVSGVYLAEPRWLIKSSSGKPGRAANRERALAELAPE